MASIRKKYVTPVPILRLTTSILVVPVAAPCAAILGAKAGSASLMGFRLNPEVEPVLISLGGLQIRWFSSINNAWNACWLWF